VLLDNDRKTALQQQQDFLAMIPAVVALRNEATTLQKTKTGGSGALSVFFTPSIAQMPLSLVQIVRQVEVFPEAVLLLQVEFLLRPFAEEGHRLALYRASEFGGPDWLFGAVIRLGFAEQRKFIAGSFVQQHILPKLSMDGFRTTFYLNQRDFVVSKQHPIYMRVWLGIFQLLHQNSARLSEFFHLPANATIEVGTRIGI